MNIETFLCQMEGKWTGRGTGQFPGIAAFRYEEETVCTYDAEKQLLHYIQQTWLLDDADKRIQASHRETGFLREVADLVLEVANVQSGGRTEILQGVLEPITGGFQILLQALLLANDPRMQNAERIWKLTAHTWEYTQRMATQTVDHLHDHLSASLTRA